MRNSNSQQTLLLISIIITVLLYTAFGEDSFSQQQIKSQMKYIMSLDDMEDTLALAQRQIIVELGPTVHPALIELLDEIDDTVAISKILGIFVDGKGDKKLAVEATKCLLQRKDINRNEKLRILVVNTLSKIGNAQDAEAIIPLIEDSSEFVRVNALRALSKLGGTNELFRLEQYIAMRMARNSIEDLQMDMSFNEGQRAIGSIKERLSRSNQ
jgi:hypothetical protein